MSGSGPAGDLGWWGVPLAVLGGAVRVGTPFLFVSLGECVTEKSGRVNLGLEGTLVMGAMAGYAISYKTGSPWLGVLVAAATGAFLGALHAVICNRPRVNSVAVGIAMMIFGIGLAKYLGKPFIQPKAPQLPAIVNCAGVLPEMVAVTAPLGIIPPLVMVNVFVACIVGGTEPKL